MESFPLSSPWDIPIAELDSYLRLAGVQPVSRDDVASARDLDGPARVALVKALRESVRQARMDAPPVEQWLTVSESIVLNDDGSEAAARKADTFWQCLTRIVNGCRALIFLGDLSEFPFFIELLRHQPAGHLVEMAAGVARHYVDPSGELDAPQLLRRAQEWWNSLSVKGTG